MRGSTSIPCISDAGGKNLRSNFVPSLALMAVFPINYQGVDGPVKARLCICIETPSWVYLLPLIQRRDKYNKTAL